MMEPLRIYFSNTVNDFDHLFSSVFEGALSEEDIGNLEEYIMDRTTIRPKSSKLMTDE